MKTKLLNKFFLALIAILSLDYMTGCTVLRLAPTSGPSATSTPVACQPSQVQKSKNDFPEIQGTMSTEGEMWALLFFDKAHAKEDVKIVWRITGSGKQFVVQGRHEDGTLTFPTWGPDIHDGSNWDHPGDEWGTGFNFPKPGCWTLTATRGTTTGEIRLDILAP
jgi:hypothetical protein